MKYLTLSIACILFASLAVAHGELPTGSSSNPLLSAQPPDLKGKSLADTFNQLFPKLEKDNGAQQQWQDICFKLGAPGNEKLRAEACTLMCAKLDAKTPTRTRLWLLTQLERIGREESVDVLAGLLNDKDDVVREAATRALANNPSPKATGKLTDALGKAEGKAKIGLLNALGHRGDKAAVDAITKELASSEVPVATAAARALGRIPAPEALRELDKAGVHVKGAVLTAVLEAILVHADRLQKTGEKDELKVAKLVYHELNAPKWPRPIRLAALRGVIQTAGDGAGELVLKALAGDDADAKDVAIGQIEYLSANALKTLATSLDKLPVPNRVAVITAIAARGDRSQLPVAVNAAKSKETDVRRAGMLALGRLGDDSTVELLLDAMTGKDALAGIAAESLAAMPAEGVNEKLVAVLAKEKTPARAVALIGILERRKAASAVPTLLTSASSADAGVRTAAFTALKALASPKHVPEMINAFFKTEKGKDREQAEVAIAWVASQVPLAEQRAEPVLAAIKNTKERTADLLPLLGRVGGEEALIVIRQHLTASNPALRDAAIIGLCNWPDTTANADLLTLAEKGKTDAEKQQAIQALTRINTGTAWIDRTPDERLAALNVMKKAMRLATRDDDRRAILSGIGFVRHIETLRFVLPYLDEPALAQAACKGVVELAHSKMLREPNKAEFEKSLNRVIAICKDKGLVDRAKQYKEGR